MFSAVPGCYGTSQLLVTGHTTVLVSQAASKMPVRETISRVMIPLTGRF